MSQPPERIRELAKEKLGRWLHEEMWRAYRAGTPVPKSNLGPYLAVSREAGAGGSEFAHEIANRLDWDLIDRTVIDFMADHYGTPRDLVEFVDERNVGWLEEFLASWVGRMDLNQAAYVHRLRRLMILAAARGNQVIVGRGAQFILPRESGFAVRVLASRAQRIEAMAQRLNKKPVDAEAAMDELDRQRSDFIRRQFHRDVADPHEYDLTLNLEHITMQEAVSIVENAVGNWLERLPDAVTATRPQ